MQPLGLTCCSPTAVRMEFFKETVGCSKSLHAVGKDDLNIYLQMGCAPYSPRLLPPLAAPPCRLGQLPALPLLAHRSQRPWLSPFPAAAALAFSRQNLSLSHRWQNSSEAFSHLSGALTSPPLLAVLFHHTQDPFTIPLVWPLRLLSPFCATLCLQSWPPPHRAVSP